MALPCLARADREAASRIQQPAQAAGAAVRGPGGHDADQAHWLAVGGQHGRVGSQAGDGLRSLPGIDGQVDGAWMDNLAREIGGELRGPAFQQ
jgi:hypothetical protein